MPRSPSRDLSDRYIGKRGYFRNPEFVRKWKYILAVFALAGAVGWAAVDVGNPSRGAYAHTHGPLAGPHAAFDDNCAACHIGQSPDLNPFSVFGARDRWHALSCGKCHAGPNDAEFAHHASATDQAREFHKRCSNCHHDHLGRLNSLVRHPDSDCNQCHSDLAKWHDAGKSRAKDKPYQDKITGFAENHPEFRSLDIAAKPRTLTFSHAVHMNPGQTYTPGGKEGMTVGHIRKLSGDAAADRYKLPGQGEDAVVKLDCAACHKLDPGTGTPEADKLKAALDAFGEPTRTLMAPRPEGAYFLPINYEVSCRACHPLTAPAATSTVDGKAVVIPGFPVPHRRQTPELVAELKAGYLRGMSGTDHPLVAPRPEPGGVLDPSPVLAARKLGEEADKLVEVAKRSVISGEAGCYKCHQKPAGGSGIAPVPDRTVWFEHAKYNHSAHRGVTCATCHPGTGGAAISTTDAAKPEPVLILGLDSCKTCHAPAGTKVALPDGTKVTGGGVRHNCTDCHRYHHGDLPLQGRGAGSRFPKEPRELADWLKGK